MADVTENSPQDIVNRYRGMVETLSKYLKWFKENDSRAVDQNYNGSNMDSTIIFPVYDSTVLSFVKDAQASGLMDRNYVYLYSRKNLKTWKDELEYISNVDIMHLDDINRIISKYVLGGQVKAGMWSEAVQHGIFEHAVRKMQELIELWDHEN